MLKSQKLSIRSEMAQKESEQMKIQKKSRKSQNKPKFVRKSRFLLTPRTSTKIPHISIDYTKLALLNESQRSWLFNFMLHIPGFQTISRLLLLDMSMFETEYLDESQELALLEKSEADLFYPIYMTRMPTVKSAPSTYFHDGKKKIEENPFAEGSEMHRKKKGIHIFQEDSDSSEFSIEALRIANRIHRDSVSRKRESYLEYLQKAGIYMEEDIVKTQNSILHFVKLSISWTLLTKFAEELQLRVPLEIQPEITTNWSSVIFHRLGVKNIFMQYVPEEPLKFYTATFKRGKLNKYLWSDQRETFFTNTQRIYIINEILQMCHFGQWEKTDIGIERLLEKEAFLKAYPLHDGHWAVSDDRESNNMRFILYEFWARPAKWFKYQPINHIRAYYGEKIAFYFAFLGFYISWLTFFAVFGLFIFAIQIYQSLGDKVVNEICESGKYYTMCPKCENCRPWHLSDYCFNYKSAAIFDSLPMIVFSLFSCLWANFFLANWKRNSYLLAYQWSSHEVVWEEQRPRANYMLNAPFLRVNPVTGRTEPHFPRKEQKLRIVVSTACLLFITFIMLISVEMSAIYRSAIIYYGNSYGGPDFFRFVSTAGNLGASILQLFVILIMGHLYSKAATTLNEWEMHRTETEFENNLIFKLFFFQFANYFSPLFYSAFLKSKFVPDPDKPTKSYLGVSMMAGNYCSGNSCFLELSTQLLTFLVIKQSVWLIAHKLKEWWQKPSKQETEESNSQQWETDFMLEEPEELTQSYLEIVLQFAFITLFAAAFPLAPLLALIRNIIEIRRSSQKLVCKCRRPVPQQAKSIEVWYDILRTIAILSAVSNGFIIAFTSDWIPKLILYSKSKGNVELYVNQTFPIIHKKGLGECRIHIQALDISRYRYLFLIVYEHIALAITLFLQVFVPKIPQSLQLRLKREQFIAKQTTTETIATLEMTSETLPSDTHRKKRIWTAWTESRQTRDESSKRSMMSRFSRW